MHWKCSEIFWGKYTVVYWVQFWDLFLDQLNGKILKMAYFFSVHRCREPRENVCMKNPDFFFVLFFFLFWKWFFFLSWLWLNYKTFDYTWSLRFFFLICKSHWIFPRKLLTRKKKTFVPWEKLMENYYNCIGVSSIENWKMSSWICSTWKIDGKNDFMPDSLFLGVLIDQISFSSFFSNIFRDSFTLEKVFPPQLSILLIYSTSLFAHFYPYYTENPDALMQSKAPPPEDRL